MMRSGREGTSRVDVVLRRLKHLFIVGVVIIAALSVWYPWLLFVTKIYVWSVGVFIGLLMVQSNMLRKQLFWILFFLLVGLHSILMWKIAAFISHISLWLIFFPLVLEGIAVAGIFELLRSRIMRSGDLCHRWPNHRDVSE